MHDIRNIVKGSVGIAVVVALASLALPLSHGGDWFALHTSLANSLLFTLINCGAAILFLVGLKAYKTKMRRAYAWIVTGIVSGVIGAIQVPINDLFGLWDTWWATSGVSALIFPFSVLAAYIGVRALCRLVGVRTIFARAWVALPITFVVSLLATFLPHAPLTAGADEMRIDIAVALLAFLSTIYIINGFLILKVIKQIGSHYTKAMSWLAIAYFGSAAITAAITVNDLATGTTNTAPTFIMVLYLVGACANMIAGYTFAKTREF